MVRTQREGESEVPQRPVYHWMAKQRSAQATKHRIASVGNEKTIIDLRINFIKAQRRRRRRKGAEVRVDKCGGARHC
jgi:hypothetical protein